MAIRDAAQQSLTFQKVVHKLGRLVGGSEKYVLLSFEVEHRLRTHRYTQAISTCKNRSKLELELELCTDAPDSCPQPAASRRQSMTSAAVGGSRRQQQLKISKLDACSQVHICSAQSSTNHKRHDWPSNTKRR